MKCINTNTCTFSLMRPKKRYTIAYIHQITTLYIKQGEGKKEMLKTALQKTKDLNLNVSYTTKRLTETRNMSFINNRKGMEMEKNKNCFYLSHLFSFSCVGYAWNTYLYMIEAEYLQNYSSPYLLFSLFFYFLFFVCFCRGEVEKENKFSDSFWNKHSLLKLKNPKFLTFKIFGALNLLFLLYFKQKWQMPYRFKGLFRRLTYASYKKDKNEIKLNSFAMLPNNSYFYFLVV